LGKLNPVSEHSYLPAFFNRQSKARLLSIYLCHIVGTAFGLTVQQELLSPITQTFN
jgi:hypothetical protein